MVKHMKVQTIKHKNTLKFEDTQYFSVAKGKLGKNNAEISVFGGERSHGLGWNKTWIKGFNYTIGIISGNRQRIIARGFSRGDLNKAKQLATAKFNEIKKDYK